MERPGLYPFLKESFPLPDVSLVLPLHHERRYLARTLRSLAEAAIFARTIGIETELVAVLDRADDETETALRLFDLSAFANVQILTVDHGSAGPTRNVGCRAATGAYIATADGDDLISYNYIERMWLRAQQLGPEVILIPKFLFAFGDSYHVTEFFDLDQVTPLVMVADHPFLSRVFFHRSCFAQLAYEDISLTNGYAYEDWHFSCDALALGHEIRVVPETILFYRQRHDSLSRGSKRISVKQIPPSLLFQPPYYRKICGPSIERLKAEGDFRRESLVQGPAILHDPICLELTVAANAIEPAIDLLRLRSSGYFNYLNANIAPGIAYDRFCEIVGDRHFDEVFLLPFMANGGADRYVLDIMVALTELQPDLRILVLFGEPFERYAWLDRLPAGCVAVDLCATFPEIGYEDRDLLSLKMMQSCAQGARLHLRPSPFAHRFFMRFAPVLVPFRPILYRFADARNDYGDYTLTEPWGFKFLAEHIWAFDKIVCDNEGIIANDRRRIGFSPEKWHLLYSKMEMPEALPPGGSRRPPSILWVSRIDHEKRPTLLLKIAKLLAIRLPETVIEIFGQPTLNAFDVQLFAKLKNVQYRGYFEHFEDIDASSHYCFLYTSRFDGVPVVLLEMISAGLPIIAPDVGGIGSLIRDRETGLLLSCSGNDDSDAELYVAALESLFANPDLRERLRVKALEFAAERHAMPGYMERIARIFGAGSGDEKPAAVKSKPMQMLEVG